MYFKPLNEYFWDIVDMAQKSIDQKYPDENSIVKKNALRELEAIVSSDKTFEEKRMDIHKRFPDLITYMIHSAESGNAEAQFTLASAYRYADGIPRDMKEASKWVHAAAEQGYAWAQMSLGGSRNDEKAILWLTKAAEQGLAEAQYLLAEKYEILAGGIHRIDADGRQYDEDCPAEDQARFLSEAVKWYREAAEQGQDMAQCCLGNCYFSGRGVDKNVENAVSWWRKSAEQGNILAQRTLVSFYLTGDGVEKDVIEAVKWIRVMAEKGDSEAQLHLGVLFLGGEDVEKDVVEGVKWLHKAAEQGEPEAQFFLAICYLDGEGVEKNRAIAVDWLKKAAKQGYGKAIDALETLREERYNRLLHRIHSRR